MNYQYIGWLLPSIDSAFFIALSLGAGICLHHCIIICRGGKLSSSAFVAGVLSMVALVIGGAYTYVDVIAGDSNIIFNSTILIVTAVLSVIFVLIASFKTIPGRKY